MFNPSAYPPPPPYPISNYIACQRRKFIHEYIVSAVNGKGVLDNGDPFFVFEQARSLAERLYPQD